MVAYHEWLSPTRLTGLTAFTASLLACVWRWVMYRKRDVSRRLYAVLAGMQLCLLLDMAFDWRWKLHDLGVRVTTGLGIYDLRQTSQLLALAVLFLTVVLFSIFIFYKFRRRLGLALALTCTLLSVGLWWVECVSLHYLDEVLYRMVGVVMMVSLMWVGLALVTCLGIWLDGSRRPCE
jgi:hypothetical protein